MLNFGVIPRSSHRTAFPPASRTSGWGRGPLEARSQGRGPGPAGPVRGQPQGDADEVGRDGRGVAAPSDAGTRRCRAGDRRAPDVRAGLGQGLGHRAGHEQAAGGQGPAEVPVGVLGRPGAVPSEAVAVDEPAGATDLEVLDDPLELEPLRKRAAIVAAGQPDVAPDQPGARGELDPAALVVAAAAERDRRAGQDDQAGVVLDARRPTAGWRSSPRPGGCAWPTGRSRRPACPPAPSISIRWPSPSMQAGGEVDQVEQRRRLVVEDERRHQADGNLLIAGPQARLVAGSGSARCVRRRPGPAGCSAGIEARGIRAESGALRA